MAGRQRLSKRDRSRLKAAQKLLGAQAPTLAYGAGRANARMTTGAWVCIGIFVAIAFIVVAVYGVLPLPGALLLLVFYNCVRPFRGVAVTPSGLAVTEVGWWGGRPSRVLGMLHPATLWPPYAQMGSRSVQVRLGPDVVSLRRRDHDRLVAAVAQAAPPPAG